jgi:hypothetical protein
LRLLLLREGKLFNYSLKTTADKLSRKKNDKTPEQREGRPASVPPESSSQQDVDVGDIAVDDTADASFSSVDTKEKSKKSRAFVEPPLKQFLEAHTN